MSSCDGGFGPAVMLRLMRELRSLVEAPVDGVCLVLGEDGSVANIAADIDGPTGTPFELGRFRLRLSLPPDFPSSPPKAVFLTKIFHPNVSAGGEVCVNTLKRDWKPTLGLRHVLLVVRCLLIQPNPESALNEEAGRLLMEAYPEYERRARLMTRVHAAALPVVKPHRDSEGKKEAAPASDGSRGGSGSAAVDEERGGQENTHINSPRHSHSQQPLTPQQQQQQATAGGGGGQAEAKRTGSEQADAEAAGGGQQQQKPAPAAVKGGNKGEKAKAAIKKSLRRL